MSSAYNQTEVALDNYNATKTDLPSASVKVYKESDGSLLTTLVTDSHGIIVSGTLSVAVGIATIWSWAGLVNTATAGKSGWMRVTTQ